MEKSKISKYLCAHAVGTIGFLKSAVIDRTFSEVCFRLLFTYRIQSRLIHFYPVHDLPDTVAKYQIRFAFHLGLSLIDDHKILPVIHMGQLRRRADFQ